MKDPNARLNLEVGNIFVSKTPNYLLDVVVLITSVSDAPPGVHGRLVLFTYLHHSRINESVGRPGEMMWEKSFTDSGFWAKVI